MPRGAVMPGRHVIPADIRLLVTSRDTPLGTWAPLCWVCGDPITGYVEIHHCRYLKRGGDDRPSNLISLHPQLVNAACHIGRCHDNRHAEGEIDNTAAMWAISRYAQDGAYYEPRWHAARGWITVDDEGGWRPGAAA